MKKLLILCSILLMMSSGAYAAGKYVKIVPEFLQPTQTTSYEKVKKKNIKKHIMKRYS